MGRACSDITFTPAVRQAQTEMGSREQYAFLDTMADRGDVLTAAQREVQGPMCVCVSRAAGAELSLDL